MPTARTEPGPPARRVDDAAVRRLATLAPGVAEVFELGPVTKGEGVNKKLQEITLPIGGFIAAIQRGNDVNLPGANDTIEEGDILIVIGPSGIESLLKKTFISA